jgi:hypothetical protein
MYSMRRQRVMVVGGFLSVAVGWSAETALFQWGVRGVDGQHAPDMVFALGSVLGYLVIACASWAWFTWMETSPVPLSGMDKVLNIFSVGYLLLAVGLSALGYHYAHQALSQPYDGRTGPVIATAYGLECFGFLVVAVAFWSASSVVRTVRPDRSLPDEALAAA